MIKIAYDPQIFSSQVYGGISRYFCEIASRISNNNDVYVRIAAPMHKNQYLRKIPQSLVSGFYTAFPANFMRFPQRAFGMLLGDLTLRALSPDLIHETYYFNYPLGPKIAKRVLTIHDMIHEKFELQNSWRDKTEKFKIAAAERADHIICVSESTKKDVIETMQVNPDKISVIHLGFDLMTSSDHLFNFKDVFTEKPFLLYVGSRGGYKNFDRFIEAFASSSILKRNFNLICFGGGEFTRLELALFKEFELQENQIRQYSGNDQLLAKFYIKASVFVYPSLYEGFGIPPLEAMAYKCPVVCSNTSSIPEVVGDAGVYFDPYSIESIRLATERVVESESLINDLIRKGENRLKFFSWDKCANETLKVYKSLL
jgi:glycosyltransferase involved in cell wall biosynthesis